MGAVGQSIVPKIKLELALNWRDKSKEAVVAGRTQGTRLVWLQSQVFHVWKSSAIFLFKFGNDLFKGSIYLRKRMVFQCLGWRGRKTNTSQILTRLHSSRMHTARSLTVSPSMHCAGGVCSQGGAWSGGCLVGGGVPRLGGGIAACTEADPPCGQNSWHALLKILPCPKLRLRAVKMNVITIHACEYLIISVRPVCLSPRGHVSYLFDHATN